MTEYISNATDVDELIFGCDEQVVSSQRGSRPEPRSHTRRVWIFVFFGILHQFLMAVCLEIC